MGEYIFSICIPVYNTEKYLPRALDSIVNQDFDTSKVEVVIVNDASPNTTECTKIIYDYSNLLSIKYIKKEKNEGTFLARKTAIQHLKGDYVLFLDADDTLQPYSLEILSKNMLDNPDYIQFRIYSIEGSTKSLMSMELEDESNKTLKDVLCDRVLHAIFNKCYNSQLLKKICEHLPDFYSVYAEDYYQSAIIEYYSKKKVFIDIPLYNYFKYVGITSPSTFENKAKVIRMIGSFRNIEYNLIDFFEKQNSIEYVQYVREYIRRLYLNLSYWVTSIIIIFFVIKNLPPEYRYLRKRILIIFIKRKLKKAVKNVMPYGLTQYIINLKTKGNTSYE